MLYRDVAPGIHRIKDSFVNWYLVEDGERLTIVDAGLPTSWSSLTAALSGLGCTFAQVEALVLTHAHFDHIGFAERLRARVGVPVLVHADDAPLARRPRQYLHERPRAPYLLRPRTWPTTWEVLRTRALLAEPVTEVRTFEQEDTLDVPGRPRLVRTPGHTLGHVSLHLPDRDAVIAGDALVTHNPYLNRRGPQIVSGAATADSGRALASLDALEATGAGVLLPGHGEPWRDGVAEAVGRARAAGAS